MEMKRHAARVARQVAEATAGGGLPGQRLGMRRSSSELSAAILAGMPGAPPPMVNPTTGRPLFVLGVDSLADLEAGRVELG